MVEKPYISVIITAFNRKNYLLYAVDSVLNQTISKEMYEIIVIKNFEDAEIDRYLESKNVRNIKIDDMPVGKYLAEGILNSKGEICCFLDDDDAFLPVKLERVYNIFAHNESLVYYRHTFEVSRNDFDLLTPYREIHNNREAEIYYKPKNIKQMVSLISKRKIALNMSTISIRKKFYENFIPILAEIKIMQDLSFFLFYVFSSSSSETFALDSNSLSVYRVHPSSTQYEKKISDLNFKTKAVRNTELHLNATALLIRYFDCLGRSVKGGESVVCQYLLLSGAGWRVQLNLLQGQKTSISDILNSLKIGIYRNSMIVIAGTFLALLGNIFLSKAISSMFLKIMKEIQGI